GIGKKTAQRLILELKDKFKDRVTVPEREDEVTPLNSLMAHSEAMETLLALGFSQDEGRKALQGIPNVQDLTTEEQVRLALRALADGK
ncbi:MAG: Holliday junction branch migration protein RuvA, partial [Desulfitobacterium sp.]|nr:Holliday junction branch migration protein RuvA [Desulfitobacterium sp.]